MRSPVNPYRQQTGAARGWVAAENGYKVLLEDKNVR